MSSSRTISRLKALQVLFAMEFNPHPSISCAEGLVDLEGEDFTLVLLNEYLKIKTEIDEQLVKKLQNWSLERLSCVDKSLIRLGAVEFKLNTADRPVIINEYVNLAKTYGSEKSGAFVNGILDSLD